MQPPHDARGRYASVQHDARMVASERHEPLLTSTQENDGNEIESNESMEQREAHACGLGDGGCDGGPIAGV